MVTTTAWISKQTGYAISGIATIDNGETATLAIPCHGKAVVRLGLPELTGTSLTFTVQAFRPDDPAAPTTDPPFRPLVDDSGNDVTVTVAGADSVIIPELSGCYAFTIVSGSSEAAAREIEVSMVGDSPNAAGNNQVTIEGGSITANQGTAGAAGWPVYDQPQSAADATATQAGSTAEEDSLVVKASAGNLYGFVVSSTVAGW
ncbi:MAG: hypothetical protein O2888_03515, partial [Chloroflexi bacterium]|nr:hypothetical protein [Chloroflexota bacterium]